MFRPPLVIASVLAAALAAPAAPAQSESDLRKENQRLQSRVTELQRELEAARTRIAELEEELKQLRSLPGAPGPGTVTAPPPPPEASIDESVSDASPRALFNALKESYEAEMKDLEIGSDSDTASLRHRTAYLRAVQGWARRVNRELKSKVEWHVRLVPSSERPPGQQGLLFVAVDPLSDARLGDPFLATLPRAMVQRLNALGASDVLLLRGVLVPQIAVNEERQSVGPFDSPRYLGPFAEFGMMVEGASVTRP